MTNTIPAAFGVNRYLWNKIIEQGVLSAANYSGLTPIIPAQEEPTFVQAMEKAAGIGAFPYIVYAWNTNGYSTSYWEMTDQIVYVIYAHDQVKLRELTLLIAGLFKRFDESADEINKYVQTATATDGTPVFSEAYKAYDYKFTSVQQLSANMSKSEETAPYKTMVTIRVNYTHGDDAKPLSEL